MKKTEFIEAMKDYASQYGEVVIQEINKPGARYTGLMIKRKGPTPVLNLDSLYHDCYIYEECDINECYKVVDKMLNAKLENAAIAPDDILKWDKVKDRLYLRLFGNVNDGIYRKMADLYIVPYIQVTTDDSGTTRVTPELLNCWGVDEDEVFRVAKINQETLRPVCVSSMAELLGLDDDPLGLYVIGTKSGILGAAAILYNGVAKMVKDLIGDFYLLPASIHELIAVPKALGKDIESLVEMVGIVNGSEVEAEERLSNSVYEFDFNNNCLVKVG